MRLKLFRSLLALIILVCWGAMAGGETCHWTDDNLGETPAGWCQMFSFSTIFLVGHYWILPVQPNYTHHRDLMQELSGGQARDGSDPDISDGTISDSSWSAIKDLF